MAPALRALAGLASRAGVRALLVHPLDGGPDMAQLPAQLVQPLLRPQRFGFQAENLGAGTRIGDLQLVELDLTAELRLAQQAFQIRVHEVKDSPLPQLLQPMNRHGSAQGSQTSTRAPRSFRGLTCTRPPSAWARSRMLTSPNPRPLGASDDIPSPSSSIVSRRPSLRARRTSTDRARPWRAAFVIASRTMRVSAS